ncbi:hypothetical protein BH10BAC5_BH10BAC5_12360 [soil metagenome]
MFGINKKIKEMQDNPEKAIENAEKTLNKGATGFLTKAFMGKEFTEKMNEGLNTAKKAMDMSNLTLTGLPGKAVVTSIADTGKMVNFNPIIILGLNVQPMYGAEFNSSGNVMVSKINVPRVGDTINIKYNASDPNDFIVVG